MTREIKVIPPDTVSPHDLAELEGSVRFGEVGAMLGRQGKNTWRFMGPFPGDVCPPMEHDGDTVDVLAEWPERFHVASRSDDGYWYHLSGRESDPIRWWHLPERTGV